MREHNQVIAAYAGTGKTTLAALFPLLTEDFVCMPYKYIFEENVYFFEDRKANPNNILRDEWPINYIHAIKQKFSNGKTLLIPSDIYVLSLLKNENITYTLCYPQRNAKEIYRKRFLDRGNTDKFIEIFIGSWDVFLDYFEQDLHGEHIVLQSNQFLSDVINIYSLRH
jgi:hypothetical protein